MLFRIGRITQAFLSLAFSIGVVGTSIPVATREEIWLALHDAIVWSTACLRAGLTVVVVVLVAPEIAPTAGTSARTGRKASWAVRPTRRRAFERSLTPGSSTMMSLPWRLMSGSATPKVLTRLLMMLRVSSSDAELNLPTGA